jgi:hypothetical protein
LTTIPATLKDIFVRGYDSSLTLSRRNFLSIFLFLKNHSLFQLKQMVEIAVYDRPGKLYRFTIIYYLLTHHFGNRIMCLAQTDELTALPSTTALYSGAG